MREIFRVGYENENSDKIVVEVKDNTFPFVDGQVSFKTRIMKHEYENILNVTINNVAIKITEDYSRLV